MGSVKTRKQYFLVFSILNNRKTRKVKNSEEGEELLHYQMCTMYLNGYIDSVSDNYYLFRTHSAAVFEFFPSKVAQCFTHQSQMI